MNIDEEMTEFDNDIHGQLWRRHSVAVNQVMMTTIKRSTLPLDIPSYAASLLAATIYPIKGFLKKNKNSRKSH